MRLLSAVLFVGLTGSWALAEEANPADSKPEVTRKKVPYRVVKTLPDSQQVLLFDRIHGTHIVAEVGEPLDEGYYVEEIDDDEVTLIAEDGTPVILAEPPPPRQPSRRVVARAKPRPADPYAGVPDAIDADNAATDLPVDPYAEVDVATATPAPAAPPLPTSATPLTARPTPAPTSTPPPRVSDRSEPTASAAAIVDAGPPELADPYGDPGIAAFAEAVGAAPPEPVPAPAPKARPIKKTKASSSTAASPEAASALASVVTGAPEPAAATVTASPAAATADVTIVTRGELDSALGDFSKLARTFRAAFTAEGVRFDAVAGGTLLAKIGLRAGDVVMSVDGKPMRTLDDAASLYARSTTMKMSAVQVVRDGKLVTLRVAIR